MDRNTFACYTIDDERRVALRKESVDRNALNVLDLYTSDVALRKESVDRNAVISLIYQQAKVVALRKESVDRNHVPGADPVRDSQSLSARRAWIEICTAETDITLIGRSLSARRAWIEIRLADMSTAWNRCRSPQGERG